LSLRGIPIDDASFMAQRLTQLLDECDELEERYYSRAPFTDRRGLRERIDALHKQIAGAANIVAAQSRVRTGRPAL
jgi:hypothetical protein